MKYVWKKAWIPNRGPMPVCSPGKDVLLEAMERALVDPGLSTPTAETGTADGSGHSSPTNPQRFWLSNLYLALCHRGRPGGLILQIKLLLLFQELLLSKKKLKLPPPPRSPRTPCRSWRACSWRGGTHRRGSRDSNLWRGGSGYWRGSATPGPYSCFYSPWR